MNRRDFVAAGAFLLGQKRFLKVALTEVSEAGGEGAAVAGSRLTGALDPAMEKKVNALLAQMTLDEKVRQLCSLRLGEKEDTNNQQGEYTPEDLPKHLGSAGVGSVSLPIAKLDARAGTERTNFIQKVSAEQTRLGIPPLIDGEGLHGLRANGSCMFPSALAMGATWDPGLVHDVAAIVGAEAHSRGLRRIFAPVLDLGRDPRHGRVEETYGEDPYLAAKLGVAFVTGLQSQNVIATPKHFVANFVGEGGRDSGDVELSERTLRELYFVPYKAAVVEGGALGLMCAYNSLNGVPCVLNGWLLTDVLREEWGFKGAVVSDWTAVSRSFTDLHATSSRGESARRAVTAGTDTEAPKLDVYNAALADEVKAGRCKIEVLDESVRRLLRLKFRLGLFENRYSDPDHAVATADTVASRKTALNIARRSIVLLKNEHSVLPLNPTLKSIAVIGPNAAKAQLGGYAPEVYRAISPLDALREQLGDGIALNYAKGCDLLGDKTDDFAEALGAAEKSDAVVLFMGGSTTTAGEEKDRADLALTGRQGELIQAIAALGKPTVVVLISGGPLTMNPWIEKVDGLLMAWYAGEEGGKAIAEILTGACNPSGHLPITFPRFTGQIPMPYNHRPYGRVGTTLEIPGVFDNVRYTPLFPFGHGLSYTTFSYSGLSISPQMIPATGKVTVSVKVTNSGSRSGEDVVQLYLSLSNCRITQPVQRLCSFQRISLAAGASQVVTFELGTEDLAFLNEQFKPEVNIGSYSILVGSSCQQGLSEEFEVVKI